MNSIILNEKEYIEKVLNSDDIIENPLYIISLVCKYKIQYECQKPKQIKSFINELLLLRCPQYETNKNYFDEYVDKAIRKSKKYPLREIDGVWITENELNTIKEINNKVFERLSFTLLCLAKYTQLINPKSNGWINFDSKTVYSLARIACSVNERYEKYSYLHKIGIIELPKKNDNLNCRVTFIDNESTKLLFINDFRELGYEYLKYCGGNYIRCAECGKLIKNNKYKNKKYCSECAAYTLKQFKILTCIDCGNTFKTDARLANRCRCDECQLIKKKDDTRLRVQKLRENKM